MGEVTPVNKEKNEFECRDNSMLKALYEKFELPTF